MCDRTIGGFIVEGADQQGKTTVIETFFKDRKVAKFGVPDKDFDFLYGYIIPYSNEWCTVYDRSFLSEIVYSRVLGREVRVKHLDRLLEYFNKAGFVFIFLEMKDFVWQDREEVYDAELNVKFLAEYRRLFEEIECEKYFLDPKDSSTSRMLYDMSVGSYSKRRLLQEIYRHDPWKMVMSCTMLNRANRTVVDRVRGNFFFRYPNAEEFLKADAEQVKGMLNVLGFQNRRYDTMRKFSIDFIIGVDVEGCYGVGKYASDSYRIFHCWDFTVEPEDLKLKEYLSWAIQTQNSKKEETKK